MTALVIAEHDNKTLSDATAKTVTAAGGDAPQVARALSGVCSLETCGSLPEAVLAAARAAHAGDTVLLSPACASLDMVRDYTQRGAVFAQAGGELAA